jgi:hypothetical protein
MHSRDVTEILKVLERRVSKLESRVSELESKGEDATLTKLKRETREGATDLISGLSSRTVSYDSCPKVVVDGKSVLDRRKILNSAPNCGETRLSRAATVESGAGRAIAPLEEGEIYEGADSAGSTVTKVTITPKKEKAVRNNPHSARPGQKGRPSCEADRVVEGSTIPNSAGDCASDITVGKMEMRFGLMVQFPSEG